MGNCLDSQAAPDDVRKSNGAPQSTSGGGRSSEHAWSTDNSNSTATTASSTLSTNGSLGSGPGAGGEGAAPLPTNGGLKAFTYGDLKAATRNFRPDSVLGEGGFGRVFKGHIDENTYVPTRPGQGMLIAVKKLNVEGDQGHREWMAELHFLGTLHHPNLVRLIGFCAENDNRLLVYEFMSRGSLDNHLFRKGQTLAWPLRMKIALHAAKGLAFLHNAQKPIIYRDFKSSNILLDTEYNAKLSDFGLAKDGPTGDKTHVTTRVMGTYGYAAPEYVATGRLTAKSDVYGYGVVLLEILTGRRAVDKNRAGGEQNLVEWAAEYLNDKRTALRIMDQRLDGQYSRREAQKSAQLALRCLNEDAKMRPTMQQIVGFLEPLLEGKRRVNDTAAAAGDASPLFSSSPYRSPLRP